MKTLTVFILSLLLSYGFIQGLQISDRSKIIPRATQCETLVSDQLQFCLADYERKPYETSLNPNHNTTARDQVASLYYNLMNWDNMNGNVPSKVCLATVKEIVCNAVFPLCVSDAKSNQVLYPCLDRCEKAYSLCNTTIHEPLGKDIAMFCLVAPNTPCFKGY